MKAKLETLSVNLAMAHGAANAEAHLARVHDVREALSHPDESVRFPARLRVSEALRGVVDYVAACTDAQGQKSLLLVMVGGAHTVRLDNAGNKLIEMTPSAEFPMDAYGNKHDDDRLNAYLRRRSANAA